MSNKAFTLIELLVVVLVIGILTSVALPQYQTAVRKSRFAGLMPLSRSIKNAEEEVFMSTGHYTSQLDTLSTRIPGEIDESGSMVTNGEGSSFSISTDGTLDYVRGLTKDGKNAYVMYLARSGRYPNEIHCEAEADNYLAEKVCLSYGMTKTATATTSGFKAYVVEGEGGEISGGYNSDTPAGRTEAFMDSIASETWGPSDYIKGEGYCKDNATVRVCCKVLNSDGSCNRYQNVWFEDEYGSYYCHSFYQDGTCSNEGLDAWTFCPVDSSSCVDFSY